MGQDIGRCTPLQLPRPRLGNPGSATARTVMKQNKTKSPKITWLLTANASRSVCIDKVSCGSTEYNFGGTILSVQFSSFSRSFQEILAK